MRVALPTDVDTLALYVPRFLALVGLPSWEKRWPQLRRDFKQSPSLQKIIADYHWLELLLLDEFAAIQKHGRIEPPLIVEDVAVLQFIANRR